MDIVNSLDKFMDEIDHIELTNRLSALEAEHQELEEYLTEGLDQLTIQRLKRRKLMIKDQISRIRSSAYPNIIA